LNLSTLAQLEALIFGAGFSFFHNLIKSFKDGKKFYETPGIIDLNVSFTDRFVVWLL
jgi:hypothetical protein